MAAAVWRAEPPWQSAGAGWSGQLEPGGAGSEPLLATLLLAAGAGSSSATRVAADVQLSRTRNESLGARRFTLETSQSWAGRLSDCCPVLLPVSSGDMWNAAD